MRIAISNLAWDVSEDKLIASLLNNYGIDAIDVAPCKYFPNLRAASAIEISNIRNWWADRGITIIGMQALLFGTTGLSMFGADDTQTAMLAHLTEICRIGAGLGAKKLVFGSPKNRDRSALSDEQTQHVALSFFRRLGDIANRYGVKFCLEPNPPCYGANFMTNSVETAEIVIGVAHPAIRMQLDTGSIKINNESPGYIIAKYGYLIEHIHISEPNLIALGEGTIDHANVALSLNTFIPDQIVTIEMLPANNEPNLATIERALKLAIRHYRSASSIKDIVK